MKSKALRDQLTAPKRRSYANETFPVTVRLDLDLRDTINILADRLDVSRSRIIQAALMESLPTLRAEADKIAPTPARAKGRATT